MKATIDPKVAVAVIAAALVVAVGVYYFVSREPGDRSGPQWTVDFHGPNRMIAPAGLRGVPAPPPTKGGAPKEQ